MATHRRFRTLAERRSATARRARGRTDASAPYELAEPEREVERLPGVEPRVAASLVLVLELLAPHVVAATQALRDVVARQFHVHRARPDIGRAARDKKLLH